MRNVAVSDAVTGISQIWNWGWTYQGLTLINCTTGLSINNGGAGKQQVGSVNVLDSSIQDCNTFVTTAWASSTSSNGSLILENIALNNVPNAVKSATGIPLLGTSSTTTISAWGQGHKYTPSGPTNFQGSFTPPTRPSALLASGSSKYYTKTKPQYEASPVSSFVSIRSAGAKGDGSTDDTAAIQSAITSAASSGRIVFFDQGTYKVTGTIYVPAGSRIIGEAYPVIMASGSKFASITSPVPVVQIGKSGESGSIEWSDMIVSTQGSAPGAVLIEWNLAAASGSGMWDVHIRIGGAAGTGLQSDTCPKTPAQVTTPKTKCIAAFLLLHITEKASAYIENSWMWTADHELDLSDHSQINVYTGRGVLVESQGPVWLWGTASEHHQLYNYQVSNAANVFMGLIQTETPYYQSNPTALVPFTPQKSWNDPDFATCTTASCKKAWGLRVMNTSDLFIYGAGLYSFFENYAQSCVNSEDCQENMVEVDCSDVHIYGLSTKAAVNMVTSSAGKSMVPQKPNKSNFCSTIALFEQSV